MKNRKQNIFEGIIGKYFLPGIILQSVLIGGGFATGREIVEYGAKFGALGWIGGVGIFIGFTVMAILTFEFARVHKAYDYRTLLRALIGKAWVLFDVVYLILAIIIIAVMAAATGEILRSTLGLNYWIGVISITLTVGLLNYYGESIIERFKTYGTIALFSAYAIFGIMVISQTGANITAVMSSGATNYMPGNVSFLPVLWTGILYVGYNLAVYPAALFTVKRQTSTKETIISGLIAGLLMCVPWFLTYFSILGYYPSEGVLGATVPWLVMLNPFDTWVIILFGIVVGWTLVETATGMIHGAIGRINSYMTEAHQTELKSKQRAQITLVTIVLAIILAQFGIIELVSTGYKYMAYAMIAVYSIPMLTIGVYKIMVFHRKTPKSDPSL